jgi:uncharacterized protein
MGFGWGEQKRESNLAKHGVDFRDVLALFDGEVFEIVDDREDYGETRFIALGEIEDRIYVVVYTWRDGNRWIISARKANEREQRKYNARHG